MKRGAKDEHQHMVEIPAVARVGVVAVQPTFAIVIPLDVEHVRVAIGVGYV